MIPEDAKKLMTFKGYRDKVLELSKYYETNKSAYEAVEREHKHYFDKGKYSSYQSYLSMQYKKNK